MSNTSPLFNLAAIDQLHLLREQFEEIYVPEGVLTELLPVRDWPEGKLIQQAFDEGWISSRAVQDQEALRVLTLDLDQGEAEAIALALEVGIPTLLIDERSGRSIAVRMNLEPTGVLGVLLRAKHPERTVRARCGELDVELRALRPAAAPPPERLGDFLASLGPWEGESTEELTARLWQARRSGGSSEPTAL